MRDERVAGYVLAGGRSSRMGQDKAMLHFGGETLLRRAVNTLRCVTDQVAVIGVRSQLEGADRAIEDRIPGCGPLGGIDAALNDLATNGELVGCQWACFLPADMPLLPPELYASLIRHWLHQATTVTQVAYVVAEGAPQPLISMIHRSALQEVELALQERRLKVTSVYEAFSDSKAADRSSGVPSKDRREHLAAGRVIRTHCFAEEQVFDGAEWSPAASELAQRKWWFSNINRPDEFEAIRTLS